VEPRSRHAHDGDVLAVDAGHRRGPPTPHEVQSRQPQQQQRLGLLDVLADGGEQTAAAARLPGAVVDVDLDHPAVNVGEDGVGDDPVGCDVQVAGKAQNGPSTSWR
jgi:hypothetical protein